MSALKSLIHDCLTGVDNKTYDIGRVHFTATLYVYFLLALVSILMGHPWSAVDFGAGAAAIAAGFGINIKLKSKTEPKL